MTENSERYRKLVLLHSNDLHGDFLAKEEEGKVVGGISRLSGYAQKVRDEEPHVIYSISGDMLQGSLIDSEYRGLSTIEIMNMLGPDVASLGNHETDYGLTHLLFLERCARFPIVNANIFITNPRTRLFESHTFIERNGMNIIFIGIITEEVMSGIRSDKLISSLIDVNEAAQEVGHICNAYRGIDVDLTVLLTHIGFEEDKKLAAMLDPKWGVDIIIGGHSHTILERPEIVNDILIVQAGVGTKQIGRFDLVVDTDLNSVHEFVWQLVPVTESNCPRDEVMEKLISAYKSETDLKFNKFLCRLPHKLTHPFRNQETELGNLFSDAIKECVGCDIVLCGSGSIRRSEMGPLVTLGDLTATVPYHEKFYLATVTGKQLKAIWRHILREEAFTGDHTEFFQTSKDLEITWSRGKQEFLRFSYMEEPIEDDRELTVAFHGFHRNNFDTSFGIPYKEVLENGHDFLVAADVQDMLVQYFSDEEPEARGIDGRLTVVP
ncbi:MAG: bifunctional metallophosphatase/5'-nucleotidase [Methanomassiliicoccaceae archaeon]|nr:bifunctional metallophosphatase/5'-nucleotidase [Methanomassiliicoccaceae archaeon]